MRHQGYFQYKKHQYFFGMEDRKMAIQFFSNLILNYQIVVEIVRFKTTTDHY